jgi:hypothetical protein
VPSVTISEDLKNKIEKAVKNGACCSVDHYVERTLKASL